MLEKIYYFVAQKISLNSIKSELFAYLLKSSNAEVVDF